MIERRFMTAAVLCACLTFSGGLASHLAAQSADNGLRVPSSIGMLMPRRLPAGEPERQSAAAMRDHRWEGAAIGAAGAGLLGLALAAGVCQGNNEGRSCTSPAVSGFMIGAALGGLAGLFVGTTIPKQDADSVRSER